MHKILTLGLALLFTASQAQADYSLQRTTSITDGKGGTFASTTTGSIDALDNGTGSMITVGTFENFALFPSTPVILVSGTVTSSIAQVMDNETLTLTGDASLTVNTKTYPVTFNELTLSKGENGPEYSGTVTVAGQEFSIIPGQIAGTIVNSISSLLE